MKEIPLRELMNMADPEAHEGIGELWNQKTIHYLVVFTSADADFEIIGAGPTLPYATLEAAGQHEIPGKKPEFYVKCPGAIAGRLLPKFAPNPGLSRPATRLPVPVVAPVPAPAAAPVAAAPPAAETAPAPVATPATEPAAPADATPSLKGRTSAPFMRPTIKLGPKKSAAAAEPGVGSGEQGAAKMEAAPSAPQKPEAPAPAAQPATSSQQPPTQPDFSAREKALAQREQELRALSDSLKIREASLRERETAIAAMEERLLNPARKSG